MLKETMECFGYDVDVDSENGKTITGWGDGQCSVVFDRLKLKEGFEKLNILNDDDAEERYDEIQHLIEDCTVHTIDDYF